MDWDIHTKDKLRVLVSRIPLFHRHIAESAVTKRAEELAKARGSQRVEEEDCIGAFFSDVPSPFYSMMVRLLEQSGFDYGKYGYPKKGLSPKGTVPV
ncbi:MAG: hypothetical protein WC658_00700 [Candidatus Omnitrophota bacterium]